MKRKSQTFLTVVFAVVATVPEGHRKDGRWVATGHSQMGWGLLAVTSKHLDLCSSIKRSFFCVSF